MKLKTLPLGSHFRLPFSGKTGTLLKLSTCSARVKYDGDTQHRQFTDTSTGEVRDFESTGRPVNISQDTEVEFLP